MTNKEAKALSEECKVDCKKSATINKVIEISCIAGEDAESAKKWSIIATLISIIAIILHFV